MLEVGVQAIFSGRPMVHVFPQGIGFAGKMLSNRSLATRYYLVIEREVASTELWLKQTNLLPEAL